MKAYCFIIEGWTCYGYKNKDDIIKDVDGQNSKRQENQEDDTNRPKLSSLHGNTMSTQIHESSKQNDELG